MSPKIKAVTAKKTAAPKAAPEPVADAAAPKAEQNADTGALLFDGEGESKIPFEQVAATVIDDLSMINAAISGAAETLPVDDAVIGHTFYKRIAEIGTAGLDSLKARLIALANATGGEAKSTFGTATVAEVAASIVKSFTDATVELLEEKGLLEQAVEMSAQMKAGIDIAAMPDEDLAVIQKYFDVEFQPHADRVNGLIALGKIKAAEVEATMDESTTRKGHARLTVKPSKKLAEYFGLPNAKEKK